MFSNGELNFCRLCLLNRFCYSWILPNKLQNTIESVDKKDKAPGMAIQEVCLALFAFIPGEILFGSFVDSACNLWVDQGCGKSGNCLGYEMPDLRLKLFGVAAIGSGVSAVFDALVWHNVKNLDIY